MVAAPAPWPTGSGATSFSSPECLTRVGRAGFLRLGFERRGARTVLTERRFTLPLQAFDPMDLDDSGVATLMLLNPTGGILAGDTLEISVALGPGTQVCLTTLAPTRVYRSPGPRAVQRFVARVGVGAALEYLPGHLIPSPGARLCQTTEIMLEPGAVAILADAWAVGRAARGEAWQFAEIESALTVSDQQGPLLVERSRLAGVRGWDDVGGAEGFSYVGTLACLAPEREDWQMLVDALYVASRVEGAGAPFGASQLGRGGVLARVLSPTAPMLGATLDSLWAACRWHLLGLGPLCLRRL